MYTAKCLLKNIQVNKVSNLLLRFQKRQNNRMVHTKQLYVILFSAYLIWTLFALLWMCSVSEMVQSLVNQKEPNKKLKIRLNYAWVLLHKNQRCRNFLIKQQQSIFTFWLLKCLNIIIEPRRSCWTTQADFETKIQTSYTESITVTQHFWS